MEIKNDFIDFGKYLQEDKLILVTKVKNPGANSNIKFLKIDKNTQKFINNKIDISIDNIIVKKSYLNLTRKDCIGLSQMEREINSLLILYKKKHFPVILAINREKKYIIMSYCGLPLENNNIPINWKDQMLEIIKTMKTCNISNNDVHRGNLLLNNNLITLVDFGWSTNKIDYPYVNITKDDINSYENFNALLDKVIPRSIPYREKFLSSLGLKLNNCGGSNE